MNREQILREAEALICQERADSYGSAKDNFSRIARLWNAYLDEDNMILPFDVGVMMALLKIGRITVDKFNPDNYMDAAGYLALAGELQSEMVDERQAEMDFGKIVEVPEGANPPPHMGNGLDDIKRWLESLERDEGNGLSQ